MNLIDQVNQIQWRSFVQYESNDINRSIPDAFQMLIEMGDCSQDYYEDVYNTFLYTMGNNHWGSYFPAVLPAIPLLGECLIHGSETTQECALDILEWLYLFQSDHDFGLFQDELGNPCTLDKLVKAKITQLRPLAEQVSGKSEKLGKAAAGLLQVLDGPHHL